MNVPWRSTYTWRPEGRTDDGRRKAVPVWLSLAALAVFALGGCGDSDSAGDGGATDPTDVVATVADNANTLTVGELLDREEQGQSGDNVIVAAMLLDDGTGMRMCEALAESFPPQCGGRSIEVMNPEAIDVELTEEQGVRWTEGSVELFGWVEGDSFFVS